jgi:hypothetical protein
MSVPVNLFLGFWFAFGSAANGDLVNPNHLGLIAVGPEMANAYGEMVRPSVPAAAS